MAYPHSYMPGAAPVGGPTARQRAVPLPIAMTVGAGLAIASGFIGYAAGFAGGGAGGAAAGPASDASTVTKVLPAPAASTVTITVPAQPPAPKDKITDGSWTVGEDFPAGTYKAVGAPDTCYWAIYKPGAAVGGAAGILNNNNGGGNPKVSLQSGQGFETHDCGTWGKVG